MRLDLRRLIGQSKSSDSGSPVVEPSPGLGADVAAMGRSDRLLDMQTMARGGLLNLLGVAASGLLQFLLVIVVTRGLKAKGAGVFFEAVALFMILSNAGELGADTGLVRAIPIHRARGRIQEIRTTLFVAIWPVLGFGVLAAVLVYVSAPSLARIFIHGAHREDVASFIRLLAPFLPLASATTVVLSGTRGFGTMKPFVWIQNIGLPFARPVLVILAIAGGLGSVALGLGYGAPLAITFVAAVLAFFTLLRRTERSEGLGQGPRRPLGELVAEFWRFAGPRGLAAVFGITVTYLDVLLVGGLRSTREAGIYAAVSRLAVVGAYALQAVGMAIAPQLSSLMARKNPDRVEAVFQTATWWLMGLSWPFYLALAVFAPLIMRIFGPEFVAGQTALTILSLAMLVNLGTGNVLMVMLMAGKSSWNLFNTTVSLALNLGLNLFLIPRYGIAGAAFAWAVSIIFVNVASVVEVRLLLGLRPFGDGYLLVALAAALCFGVVGLAIRYFLGMSVSTFSLFMAIATPAYVALLWRFREQLQFSALAEAIRLNRRSATPPGNTVQVG